MPFDESVCVPFLLRYPAAYGTEGRDVADPITTPDIMPTLLSLCGLETPDTVKGADMGPALAGETGEGRTGVLIACYHPFADWRTARGGRPFRGIRTQRHTFVRDRNGAWLLFDNVEDPFQMEILVNRAAAVPIQQSFDAELTRILESQGDTFESLEALRKRWDYAVDDDEAIPYSW